MGIFEQLVRKAQASGDEIFARFVDSRCHEKAAMSYAELERRSARVAAALRARSASPVILLLPTGPELLVTLVGALRAGAIPVVCEPSRRSAGTHDRLRAIVDNCVPRVIVAQSEGAARAVEGAAPVITPAELEAAGGDGTAPLPPPRPDDVAYLQYTSGSTGRPKATVVTFAALADNEEQIRHSFAFDESCLMVTWLPPYHDMGLVGGILQPLYTGFPVVIIDTLDFMRRPQIWMQAVSRYRATVTGGPAFAWTQALHRTPEEIIGTLDLSSLRIAFVGAEPVRVDILEAFARKFASTGFQPRAFFPCYGLAEATLFVSGGPVGSGVKLVRRPNAGAGTRDVSCGRIGERLRVRIVHPDTHRPLPDGEIGEIWIAGRSLAQGYFRSNNEAFERRIAGEDDTTFFSTGDLGYVIDGELIVTGRIKNVLKVYGKKFLAEEIEAVAYAADESIVCAAAYRASNASGECVNLYLEVIRGVAPDVVKSVVAQAATARLGIRINQIDVVRRGAIPKTVSGKIDRGKLSLLSAALARTVLAGPEPEDQPA